MEALTAALYDRLAGDAELAGMLSTYRATPQGASRPAVFTVDPAPGNARLPFVVLPGPVADTAYDTKTRRGRQIWRDARCYAAADGGSELIERIAERVRALLHRQPLEIDGYGVGGSECSGPVGADDADAYGRIVTVRLIVMEDAG